MGDVLGYSLPLLPLIALLESDLERCGPLCVNNAISAEALAPSALLVNARRLLSLIAGRSGAPVLPVGRFSAEFEANLVRALWWGPSGDFETTTGRPTPVTYEPRPICLMRRALLAIGALVRHGPTLDVSERGRFLLDNANGGALYAALLRAYFVTLDHQDLDGQRPLPVSWAHVPYALWAIGTLQPRSYPTLGLLHSLIPRHVLAAEQGPEVSDTHCLTSNGSPSVEEILHLRLLEPLLDFGLLERTAGSTDRHQGSRGWRRGCLYDRVIHFVF